MKSRATAARAPCCPTRNFCSTSSRRISLTRRRKSNFPKISRACSSPINRTWDGTARFPPDTIFLSALTGEGLGNLEAKIESALLTDVADETETVLTINARQNATLQRAAQSLARAREALRGSTGLELVSIELRDALHDLAEVIGETDNEDILTRLFQNFCIGK